MRPAVKCEAWLPRIHWAVAYRLLQQRVQALVLRFATEISVKRVG